MTDNEILTELVKWCRKQAKKEGNRMYFVAESRAAEDAYDHVADHIEELLGGNND